MPTFSLSQRLKIALGGFVSFAGFLILVAMIMTATGTANLEGIFQNGLMIGAVAFIGFIDVVCGLMLVLRDKEADWLRRLIPSKKKKADDDVD